MDRVMHEIDQLRSEHREGPTTAGRLSEDAASLPAVRAQPDKANTASASASHPARVHAPPADAAATAAASASRAHAASGGPTLSEIQETIRSVIGTAQAIRKQDYILKRLSYPEMHSRERTIEDAQAKTSNGCFLTRTSRIIRDRPIAREPAMSRIKTRTPL